VLVNPSDTAPIESVITDAQAAASSIGLQIEVFTAANNREIDVAFASLTERRIEALSVYPSLRATLCPRFISIARLPKPAD
jgi:hypothetical protein